MEAKSSCQSNHNKVGLISINFIWFSTNFSKPGMKNIKAIRNGIVTAGSNGTVANIDEQCQKFRYIAKFTTCSEISALAVLCINDPVLVFLLSALIVIVLVRVVW